MDQSKARDFEALFLQEAERRRQVKEEKEHAEDSWKQADDLRRQAEDLARQEAEGRKHAEEQVRQVK